MENSGRTASGTVSAAEVHNAAGNACFKQEDYEGAYRHYSKAIKADKTVAKYWTNRANALLRSGRTRQVIEDADAAISADPSWVKGYVFRGLALEKLGDLTQAIEALRQATAVDPDCTDAVDALNRCLEAEASRHRQSTNAASRDFCSDPARACGPLLQHLRSGARGLQGLPPGVQAGQLRQLGKISDLLVKADRLRSSIPPDFKAAAQLYKQAAELGSASGQFNYGQMIQQRQINDQPVHAAVPWLLKAAVQSPQHPVLPLLPNVGVIQSWVTLGDMYRDGLTGSAPDYAAAMQWYMKAADTGDAFAQNNIAQLYASGKGVKRDMVAYYEWLQQAAAQGYGVAEYNLAVLLYKGAEGVDQDESAALEWARKAHQHGFAEAAALLATLAPSCSEAAAALQQAAESGDREGCFLLARAYFEGLHGLDRDLKCARKWLKQAASSNHPLAQLQLGVAYRFGTWGCEVKPSQALSWIERAAYQGLAEAQLEAARCHMLGIGTKMDLKKAQQWAQKAADQGSEDAQQLMNSLKDGSWSRSRKAAKSAAQGTTPLTGDPAAMLQHMLSEAGMPEEVTSTLMKLGQKALDDQANPPSMFSAGSSDKFSLEAMLPYKDSPSVIPYLQAKRAMYEGLAILGKPAGTEEDFNAGITTLAAGYALAQCVMRVLPGLLEPLEDFLQDHPNHAAAILVHLNLAGQSRGHHWMLKRMNKVIELAEDQLGSKMYAHLLRNRAELKMWPVVADYEGALQDVEAALKLMPDNADMLYVRAAALYFGCRPSGGRQLPGSSRSNGRAKLGPAKHQQTATAFRDFLDKSAPDNRKRPHGFYTLALHTLHHKTVGGDAAATEAACVEAEDLYAAGQAAEADLPPFFLPAECGAAEVVMPTISTLSSYKQVQAEEDSSRAGWLQQQQQQREQQQVPSQGNWCG